jgi:hypothetical protein
MTRIRQISTDFLLNLYVIFFEGGDRNDFSIPFLPHPKIRSIRVLFTTCGMTTLREQEIIFILGMK